MFSFGQRKREKFVRRAEDLAGACQSEFYKTMRAELCAAYAEEIAGKISAALANYVFRFGYVAPDHAQDKILMRYVFTELPHMSLSFGEAFKTNATGVLILLAAAWQMDL